MNNRIAKIGSLVSTLTVIVTLAGCGQIPSLPSNIRAETNSSSTAELKKNEISSASSDLVSTVGGDTSSDATVTTEKPEINASKIWDKYNQDPDNKTPTYDGNLETATGVITYIGKDDHGTDSMQISDTKDGTSYVLGVFGSAEEMSKVSVGDTVTITGNFHIMSSHNMVVLKNCKILNIYK